MMGALNVFEGVGETQIRLAVFVVVLVLFGLLEVLRPRRALAVSKVRRWTTNLSIAGINAVLVRVMAGLAVPLAAVATAAAANSAGAGLFNLTDWPVWVEFLLAVLVLDFAIWLQHLASHKIPLLWQLHQVHHADRDVDVTTALRFHPLEIGLSMLWKMLVVVLLGASVLAVVVFEILLNACAMFNHANLRLPGGLDRLLRLAVVTPDMHRVHHSVYRDEHDSNYGFNLSVWDRLFRTYTVAPRDGHEAMRLGLTGYQSEAPSRLRWSLGLPFSRRQP